MAQLPREDVRRLTNIVALSSEALSNSIASTLGKFIHENEWGTDRHDSKVFQFDASKLSSKAEFEDWVEKANQNLQEAYKNTEFYNRPMNFVLVHGRKNESMHFQELFISDNNSLNSLQPMVVMVLPDFGTENSRQVPFGLSLATSPTFEDSSLTLKVEMNQMFPGVAIPMLPVPKSFGTYHPLEDPRHFESIP